MGEIEERRRSVGALTRRALEIADKGIKRHNPEHILTAKEMLEEVLKEMLLIQELSEAREASGGQDDPETEEGPS